MKIDKISGSYNMYKMELSFGELISVMEAMEENHAGPVADEVYQGLKFYLSRLPGPGEEKEDVKKAPAAKPEQGGGEFEPPLPPADKGDELVARGDHVDSVLPEPPAA